MTAVCVKGLTASVPSFLDVFSCLFFVVGRVGRLVVGRRRQAIVLRSALGRPLLSARLCGVR